MLASLAPDLWTLLGSGLVLLATATHRARLARRASGRRREPPPPPLSASSLRPHR